MVSWYRAVFYWPFDFIPFVITHLQRDILVGTGIVFSGALTTYRLRKYKNLDFADPLSGTLIRAIHFANIDYYHWENRRGSHQPGTVPIWAMILCTVAWVVPLALMNNTGRLIELSIIAIAVLSGWLLPPQASDSQPIYAIKTILLLPLSLVVPSLIILHFGQRIIGLSLLIFVGLLISDWALVQVGGPFDNVFEHLPLPPP